MDNMTKFLYTIAFSEGCWDYSNDCPDYHKVVNGNPKLRLNDLNDCNRIEVDLGHGLKSTASGAFQILSRFYDTYKHQLGLKDFSEESQQAIAKQMIHECHATQAITDGHIEQAITLCKSRWASLPGASYGQHTNKMQDLLNFYNSL